ncbi:MAG: DMT family transporter [Thermoanaerobaculia bacterium]|nr:DMT family transporter [Thermoanaerobaculia bacterium]
MTRGAALPRLQVLGAALFFSTGGALIKATALTSWQVASFRGALAAAALGILLPRARRRITRRTAAVGLAYAGALIFYALANKLTTAASTIFLQSTAPLYILILGPWLLGETPSRRDLGFMGALAAGLALVFLDLEPVASATAPQPLAGNLLALAGGVSFAFAIVGLRWLGRDGADPADAMAAVIAGNLIAFGVCLPPALPVADAGPRDWALVAFLGLFQVALAYLLLTAGLRRVAALEASLLLLIEPVLNPIWAWWLQGEVPGRLALAGGLVILTATAARVATGGRAAPARGAPPPADRSGDRGDARGPR